MSKVLNPTLLGVQEAGRLVGNMVTLRDLEGTSREGAIRSLSTSYGLPFSALWALLYRPPQRLEHGFAMRLIAAYRAEVERVAARLAHDIETLEAAHAVDQTSLDEARALLALARRKLERKA